MATIEVDRERVIVAAKAYVLRWEKRVESEREEMIAYQMYGRRFFRAKTREQAIERLKRPIHLRVSAWDEPSITGGLWYGRAIRILRAAQEADSRFVRLSDEDTFIFRGTAA